MATDPNTTDARAEEQRKAEQQRRMDNAVRATLAVLDRKRESEEWNRADERIEEAEKAVDYAGEMLKREDIDGSGDVWFTFADMAGDALVKRLNAALNTKAPTWAAVVRKLELLVEREDAEEGDALHTILEDARHLLATTPRWLEPETLA